MIVWLWLSSGFFTKSSASPSRSAKVTAQTSREVPGRRNDTFLTKQHFIVPPPPFVSAASPRAQSPPGRFWSILSGLRKHRRGKEEDPGSRRRNKNCQRIAGRKRTEEDPFSNRPFWASITSPLARGGLPGSERQKRPCRRGKLPHESAPATWSEAASPETQASGYYCHSIHWLQLSSDSSWVRELATSSARGPCSNTLTLKICRI